MTQQNRIKEHQQLLEHLLDQEYIKGEETMNQFLDSISSKFYCQLLDDMTYKNEEL